MLEVRLQPYMVFCSPLFTTHTPRSKRERIIRPYVLSFLLVSLLSIACLPALPLALALESHFKSDGATMGAGFVFHALFFIPRIVCFSVSLLGIGISRFIFGTLVAIKSRRIDVVWCDEVTCFQ